jgi:signal transduction histidine kinase
MAAMYSGIQIRQHIHLQESDVPGELGIVVFRVLQEAVNNAIRHSRCSRISIELRSGSDSLVLTVEDDGVGMDDRGESAGMGLSIMDYRARALGGSIAHESHPTGGTRIRCVFTAAQAAMTEWGPDTDEQARSA